ncbi:D-alanine--D-alanine ligase [Rhodocaloribacter litoris]|uniref:D-alanine--D-alanine ligase family protein n=1 Tax=Rhodocaloribacter litoris TaxID=2558931 RepID=UPI001423E72A|nr:D-alanine--D-alanine ligase [Rhodocaloribacter litoris]QXD14652.1 D-alanine--D-alanine ligase [Rhodocaloribacter litoris]GIV59574.1 MAG: D-alanine--D-alanine ligase [Rhodothermaceae bacterium]
MRIGLVYDLFEDYPWVPGEAPDADAENEPPETVEALAAAVRALGYVPVPVGTAFDLLRRLDTLELDAAVNIAEGARSRNREAYAPILLEMAGIPCLGSDALTLSLSLDKAWTKDLAVAAGVPTPPYRIYASAGDVDADDLPGPFPLFVKPRYEGSSKGITAESRVDTVEALRAQVDRIVSAYDQDALVEPFIEGGGEFTVAVVGNDPPEALPVLQRAVETTTRIGLHALERRGLPGRTWDYALEGTLSPALEKELQRLALRVYAKLQCRDFARLDFRVDATGRPWFLEINPLPTFAPDGTFAILAELTGRTYPDFLADVLARGFRRLGLPLATRRRAG